MRTKTYSLWIKTGAKEYMESLFNDGIIWMNTIGSFRKHAKDNPRYDPHEGASWIKQCASGEIEVMSKVFKLKPPIQIYGYEEHHQGNIYCLYSVEKPADTFGLDKPQHLGVDFSVLDFEGENDTAIVILNVLEFLNRVERIAKIEGYKFDHRYIEYYDPMVEEGALGPFLKSKKYEPQREYRFWIANIETKEIPLEIGSIKDIAMILTAKDCEKFYYKSVDAQGNE